MTHRPRYSILALCVVALSSLLAAGESELRFREAPSPRHLFHLCRSGKTGAQVDIRATPVRDDVIILYESWFKHYPRYYDGQRLAAGVPQLTVMDLHEQDVRELVGRSIPDPNFDGWAVLDFEAWWPDWDHWVSDEMKEQSLQLVRDERPGLDEARATALAKHRFESAASDFLLATLRIARQERPRARWGFYGAYPSDRRPMTAGTRRVLDEVDALYPSVYAWKFTVPDKDQPGPDQHRKRDYIQRIERIVGQARRGANGRPVLAFAMMRYHQAAGRYAGQPLHPLDLDVMLSQPFESGADAVIIWGHVDTPAQAAEVEVSIRSRARKTMRRVMRTHRRTHPISVAPDPPVVDPR